MMPYIIRSFDRALDTGLILGTYSTSCAHSMQPAACRPWVTRAAQSLCLRVIDDARWQTHVAALVKGGQLAGWISVRMEGNHNHYRMLFCYVKHAFRREGIARSLIQAAVPPGAQLVMAWTPLGAGGLQWLKAMGITIDDGRIP